MLPLLLLLQLCSSKSNIIYHLSSLITFALLTDATVLESRKTFPSCKATCSPHITLPCDFGSLDQCIMRSCRDACWMDGHRNVQSCFCRGSLEGPTLRTCFCGPSKIQENNTSNEKLLFI
ncbi:unnamed protein product [Litomosoides sigmodontis]|uniref:Uncharacterized protein n=1 Tax=Litomosoides sigmodontis TaxID=42156 RepID=A0A3P6SN49_LITSI|nr:unnamed protein product [Litomosoides sigmodontis]